MEDAKADFFKMAELVETVSMFAEANNKVINNGIRRIKTRQSNLLPPLYGSKAHHTSIHAIAHRAGHHLPAVPRLDGIMGEGLPARE